jgi:hypothetical protein
MTQPTPIRSDESRFKGAVEDDSLHPDSKRHSHNSMAGQLGHRDQDEMLKENDTDYPEPDAEAEHSGS